MFDAELFSGVVDKRFTDEGRLGYHVTFEDGDSAEYSEDEIEEMVALRSKAKASSGRRKRGLPGSHGSVQSGSRGVTRKPRFG